jgi:hypothetical protein
LLLFNLNIDDILFFLKLIQQCSRIVTNRDEIGGRPNSGRLVTVTETGRRDGLETGGSQEQKTRKNIEMHHRENQP